VIGPATLSHGDKCGGKVNGGSAGEAGMYTDCRVQTLRVMPAISEGSPLPRCWSSDQSGAPYGLAGRRMVLVRSFG
jgi:hypothetical protein